MSSKSNDPNKEYDSTIEVGRPIYTQVQLETALNDAIYDTSEALEVKHKADIKKAGDEAVQAWKLEVQQEIKEKMDHYKNMAKSSALDAVKGGEDDREHRERSAMSSYNIYTGLEYAYEIVRALR